MIEKKILVVDDEVYIRDVFEKAFEPAGYTVFKAESAEEALKILQDESIMVMFLDIKLPGMSGIDLCKKIRVENKICILHAFTGYSNINGLLACRDAGFDDFFVKPVDISLLLKAAENAFEKLGRWGIQEFDLL